MPQAILACPDTPESKTRAVEAHQWVCYNHGQVPARILILTTTGSWGGTENQIAHQARHLLAQGFQVTAGTLMDGDGTLLRELSASPEITTFSLHTTMRTPWRVMDLATRLGDDRPSLVIAYLFHPYLVARILGKLFRRIPVISSFRSGGQEKWRSFLDRMTMPLTDFYVVPSEDSARFAREELRVPEKKLRVIPIGLDIAWLRSPNIPREQTREQLGLAEQDFVIGCVARFHPVKDHETLLRAFKELRGSEEGKYSKLLLVGKGEDDLKVRSLTEKLELLEHVVFAGFRRDLPEIYSAMDAACYTSRMEGLGNAAVEALSVGLPVIATSAPGFTTYLRHEQNALLAPVGDPKAISRAIARVISEPELASRISRQASADALERYSLKACSTAYDALIRELLGSPP